MSTVLEARELTRHYNVSRGLFQPAATVQALNGMGATIVMVTHDPELARRAHRNVQVIDGQITDYKPYEAHSASVTVLHPQAADATYG